MCFIILYYTLLCITILYYTIVYHPMTFYTISYYIKLFYTILTFMLPYNIIQYCTTPHYTILHTILPSYSKCNLSTSRISITWELVRIAESHPNLLNQNLHFSESSRWFKSIFKFERPSSALPCCSKKQYRTIPSIQTLEQDGLKFKSQLCYLLGPNNLILLCFSFPNCKILSI